MIEAKDVSCTFARNPFSKEGFMAVSPVSIQFIDGERYAIVAVSYTHLRGDRRRREDRRPGGKRGQADRRRLPRHGGTLPFVGAL